MLRNGLALDRQNPFSITPMNLCVESPGNPKIKELVKLRESPRRRKERGLFFVEGGDDLLALVKAGRQVEEVYYCRSQMADGRENIQIAEFTTLGITIIEVSPAAFSKASYRSANYGIIGTVRVWELELENDSIDENVPVVILDEVEKPGNLGAVLRSVEAFGGGGIILSDPSVDFFNPNVVRASRGLIGRVPLAVGTKEEVWNWLKNSGRKIVATSAHATKYLGKDALPGSTAFIFGSEKSGLGEFWKNQPLDWIKIPMRGTASSLNINVSVACLLYELNRSSA